eukprot:TRINITY_DN67368_c0_g1_i1.p2 TRINITY_DN67368_c0_g1~~TRINITY_DN67368_c0_g1_i1.p2  ORF type:complete len:140 (-),score=6.03 TRINITY_DN67368_c0_g1_i1:592-1011(-)
MAKTQSHGYPWLTYWLLYISLYNYIMAALFTFKPDMVEHLFPEANAKLSSFGDTSGMLRRLITVWTLTFAVLRTFSALHPFNKPLFLSSYASFWLWLGWTLNEVLIQGTVPLKTMAFGITMGVISLTWMTAHLLKNKMA